MAKNMMNKAHKATNKAYRENWDKINWKGKKNDTKLRERST